MIKLKTLDELLADGWTKEGTKDNCLTIHPRAMARLGEELDGDYTLGYSGEFIQYKLWKEVGKIIIDNKETYIDNDIVDYTND